jgi:hypothetical protein
MENNETSINRRILALYHRLHACGSPVLSDGAVIGEASESSSPPRRVVIAKTESAKRFT